MIYHLCPEGLGSVAPHTMWLEARTTSLPPLQGSSCQKPNAIAFVPTGGPSLANLLSHLGPAVMTEPGQRHFENTGAHWSHSSSKTSWGHCYSLKNSQEPRDGRCWHSKSKWHLRCQLNRCSSSSSALPLLVGLPI